MKIALIGPPNLVVKPDSKDYQAEYIYNLLEGLQAKGQQLTYFGLYGSKVSCDFYNLNFDAINWQGAEMISEELRSFENQQQAYREVFSYINESDFDLVQDFSGNSFPIFAAQFLNIPTVTTLYDYPEGSLLQGTVQLNKSEKNLYVTLNHNMAQQWGTHVQIDEIIYRGINIENWPLQDKPDNNFLVFADVSEESQLENYLEVSQNNKFNVKIAGDLEDENLLKKLESSANNKFDYLGKVESRKFEKILPKTSAICVTGKYFKKYCEIILHALSSGVPIIMIGKNFQTDHIPDACGIYITEPSAKNLQQAFLSVLGKERKNCHDFIEKTFTYPKMVEEYFNLYQKILF